MMGIVGVSGIKKGEGVGGGGGGFDKFRKGLLECKIGMGQRLLT